MSHLFIGVDVGSSSVRAGLYDTLGQKLGYCEHSIRIWTNPDAPEGYYEQSTADIWAAVCYTVKEVTKGYSSDAVQGIGFDATCSLAVVGKDGGPVTVSKSRDPARNVIMWQDHRALAEADAINLTNHPVLEFVGGKISPEMSPPKLLWLKTHLYDDCWSKAGHFLDLADYMTYRTTGAHSRSLCCVVCKWTYIGHHPPLEKCVNRRVTHGWNDSFWQKIGLGDLVEEGYTRIGTVIQNPGEPVGHGLTPEAAAELGLKTGTPVATALIDAHAGGLGLVAADLTSLGGTQLYNITSRLAVIGGTSTCLMATSNDPVFVHGVWGPYYSAMVPEKFLSEGGQSATGSVIDFVLRSHSESFAEVKQLASKAGTTVYEELNSILKRLAETKSFLSTAFLTQNIHVLPDYHGNRSPLADPHVCGMVCGLTLATNVETLSILYLAHIQALAYGVRHIVEEMNRAGHNLATILLCGGLAQNNLYVQTLADITGFPVIIMEDSVLRGSAILAAVSTGGLLVTEAMKKMCGRNFGVVRPCGVPAIVEYHHKKYRVFRELYDDQKKYACLMKM